MGILYTAASSTARGCITTCAGLYPWVGRVDALYVRIDLAALGGQGHGQGYWDEVGTAPTQGGDVHILLGGSRGGTLEPGHNDDASLLQLFLYPVGLYGCDARLAKDSVGPDSSLSPGQANSILT